LFYLKDYFPLKKEAIQVAKQFNIDKIVIIKQQYFPEFIEKKLHFLPKHRVDRIAYELGVKLNSFNYDIFPQKQHYKQAQVFLEGYNMKDSPLIGLHTMPSNAGPRTWKLKNVKLLSEYFHNRYGYKFIHFHNKKSYHLEKSRESINLNNKYVYSTYQENGEELDILTVAVLAKKCKAVIAIDSAIAYIANAVKTPLILLCHPKNPIEERMPRTGIISGINDENFTFDKVRKTLIETLNKAGYKYEN
jgi:ADP-heptose:LPS heptosyltransferase